MAKVPAPGLYRVNIRVGDSSFKSRTDLCINSVQVTTGLQLNPGQYSTVSVLGIKEICFSLYLFDYYF